MSCENERSLQAVFPFHSRSFRLLRPIGQAAGDEPLSGLETRRDIEIRENRSFSFTVVSPCEGSRPRGAILLFHGLNEKSWEKYHPWAAELAARTDKAVVLFPIAFHMNRAPATWSNPRAMIQAAAARQERLSPITATSFVNVALSTRLERAPERFLLSGLETYYDVLQLVDEIRAGRLPIVAPDAPIDLFGYSIGAFLVEMLLFENSLNRFGSSKGVLFCGGSTLAEMTPVSKYIMDSRAQRALLDFYGEGFTGEIQKNPGLRRLFERIQSLGTAFRSMLFPDQLREFRLERLASIGRRLAALVLPRDQVMPSAAIARTLSEGLEPARAPVVETLDFAYDYSHEQPFPPAERLRREVDRALRIVMGRAADHLA